MRVEGMEPLQKILLDECRRAGNEKKLAKELGISPCYLSHILGGHYPVPEKIAKQYGYQYLIRYPNDVRTVVYRKIEE